MIYDSGYVSLDHLLLSRHPAQSQPTLSYHTRKGVSVDNVVWAQFWVSAVMPDPPRGHEIAYYKTRLFIKFPRDHPVSDLKIRLHNHIPFQWDKGSVTGTHLTIERSGYTLFSPRVNPTRGEKFTRGEESAKPHHHETLNPYPRWQRGGRRDFQDSDCGGARAAHAVLQQGLPGPTGAPRSLKKAFP